MDDYLQFCLKHQLFPPGQEASSKNGEPLWFIFQNDQLIIEKLPKGECAVPRISPAQLGLEEIFQSNLGSYNNSNCFLAEVKKGVRLPEHLSLVPLRFLLGKIEQDHFTIAGRGLQILHFQAEHTYCGKCGSINEDRPKELAKICPTCNHISFPRVSPAVIMSVTKHDKILLGRSPHFPEGMYSTLAGFVEPGETLEESVKREVLEETDIRVNNIKYVASQPWPFPHSMMIGFSAEYLHGEIKIDTKELEDAQWFSVASLPPLPRHGTIARHLIDQFINSCSRP